MNMLSYRAIQNLKSLSKKELSEFNKWLKPGWANSNKKLYELFTILRGFHPNFTSQKLTKLHLYKKLHPTKEYHEKELLNLFSKLSIAIEEFLVHRYVKTNPEIQADLLLAVKKNRQSSTEKEVKLINNKINRLETREIKSTQDLLDLIKYNQLKTQVINPKSGDLDKQSSFLQIDSYLDQYYTLSKARNAMEILEWTRQLSEKKLPNPWYLQTPDTSTQLPATKFYRQYHQTVKFPSIDRFEKLGILFKQILTNIPVKDQRTIYLLLVNEGARLKRAGEIKILDQIFLLNKLAVDEGIVLENGLITPHSYANILTTACQQKKFDYAINFLATHGKRLPQVMQQDGIEWGKLMISHKRGMPSTIKEAQQLAQHTKAYTVFSLRIRVLITQILFDAYQKDELGTDERFESHIDAFEKKLSREKTYPQKQIAGLSKFHHYAKILAGYFRGPKLTSSEAASLQQAINGEKSLHAKAWLLAKLQKMKKGAD